MTKIEMVYNPFTVDTKISVNGEESFGKLSRYKKDRLQKWVDDLFPLLTDECNDDLDMKFYGTKLDFEDVEAALVRFNGRKPRITVSLEGVISRDAVGRLEELSRLFDKMQAECPFEDLRSEKIAEDFKNAVGQDFKVAVIATMSSGKSTLINAMLGRELMPSKNESCTATVTYIKDEDKSGGFSARCSDRNTNQIEGLSTEDLTYDQMKSFNEDKSVSYIDVEGKIPFVTSRDMRLIMVDTPGPNNARTQEHKALTYSFIHENDMPMVLYVLNGTQLQIQDDKTLLRELADATQVGGRQAKDRFIFAVNRLDDFDVEKDDSVEGAIERVRDYLKATIGIENANLYPISAERAKVLRMAMNGEKLTRRQNQARLSAIEDIGCEDMHLETYNESFSPSVKEVLRRRLEAAKANDDEDGEALIHTGVPAIEAAINEYMNRYAVTGKIERAINVFRRKIAEKELTERLTKILEANEEERKRIQENIKAMRARIDDGKMTNEFRQKITQLDISSDVKKRLRSVRAQIHKALEEAYASAGASPRMSTDEAERMLRSFRNRVETEETALPVKLQTIIDETIGRAARELLKEYGERIAKLMGESIAVGRFKPEVMIEMIGADLPDYAAMMNRYGFSESKSIVVGREWVKNANKKWYKPWTWFEEAGHYKDIREYRKENYVNGLGFITDHIEAIKEKFSDDIQKAGVEAEKEAKRFRRFFLEELEKLDSAVRERLNGIESLTRSQEALKQAFEENREKYQWLQNFQKQLDDVLKVK